MENARAQKNIGENLSQKAFPVFIIICISLLVQHGIHVLDKLCRSLVE